MLCEHLCSHFCPRVLVCVIRLSSSLFHCPLSACARYACVRSPRLTLSSLLLASLGGLTVRRRERSRDDRLHDAQCSTVTCRGGGRSSVQDENTDVERTSRIGAYTRVDAPYADVCISARVPVVPSYHCVALRRVSCAIVRSVRTVAPRRSHRAGRQETDDTFERFDHSIASRSINSITHAEQCWWCLR
jgi:hypothetical protein